MMMRLTIIALALGGFPVLASAQLLPADRDASANWKMAGLQSVGGIPNRSTICANVVPRGSGQDDTVNIQNVINACPDNTVVQLTAGTFTIAEGHTIQLNRAVTLRGAGASATILNRPNGARVGTSSPGSSPSAVINVSGSPASGSTTSLSTDVAQGATSVQVANATGYRVGEIVLLDEASGAGWQPDRSGQGLQIWASPDYRVAWNIHNPGISGDDCCLGDNSSIFGYFQVHPDHPTNEMHQISAVSGNTITFDSPVTISYRVSHGAQLTPMISGPTNAGVEELAVKGGDDSNIHFQNTAYAWAKNVESSYYLNDGFRIERAFRLQLEGVYVHHAAWPVPGGAGYNISLAFGTSEVLIENSISVLANKVMVARASGAGSVIAYNYMDDGFISGSDSWVEIGLNASHLTGPHHVLFEGNWGFNADSDQTHGNSIYMTYFRNWLTGFRSKFTDYLNSQVVDDSTSGSPRRAAAAHAFAYWHSFIGNVLGMAGKVGNWTYNCTGGRNQIPGNCIWDLGLVDIAPQGWDLQLAPLTIQDGNYDYLTNAIHWAANDTAHTLPDSLYLASKPAFFGGSCQWPWVNPVTGTTAPLPAKARYDAGTPNNTSSCGTAPPPPPTPTASLTANPTSITAGQSSTLTWGSANATSCNGGGFSTGGTVSGSTSVSPAQTTAYSLSCIGAGGSASAAATVTVGSVPPPPGTFQVGAQVVTTSATPVRSKAGAKAGSKLRCTQPSGATGSIVGGPQTNQGTWWNINYSSGCDGWSPESGLSVAK